MILLSRHGYCDTLWNVQIPNKILTDSTGSSQWRFNILGVQVWDDNIIPFWFQCFTGNIQWKDYDKIQYTELLANLWQTCSVWLFRILQKESLWCKELGILQECQYIIVIIVYNEGIDKSVHFHQISSD
jgi:hypothetical protein